MSGHKVTKCPDCRSKRVWMHGLDDGDEYYCDDCGEEIEDEIGFCHCEDCWEFFCHDCYRTKYKALPNSALKALKRLGRDTDVDAKKPGEKKASGKKKRKTKEPPLGPLTGDEAPAAVLAGTTQASLRTLLSCFGDAEAAKQPAWSVARAACRRAQTAAADAASDAATEE